MTDIHPGFGEQPLNFKSSKPGTICRYIGLQDDQETFFQYPSDWNLCHRRAVSTIPISKKYQGNVCLREEHGSCPLFQPDWDGKVPPKILYGTERRGKRERREIQRNIFIGLLLTLACVVYIGFISTRTSGGRGRIQAVRLLVQRIVTGGGSGGSPAGFQLPSPTPTLFIDLSPTPSRTPAPTPTLAPTFTPAPTNTPFFSEPTQTPVIPPTPGPGLMTPFGPESGYLIHVVQAGESYLSIADLYGTTPAVLQGVNPTVEGASLWVGRQIVIPVGVTSLGSLPQFVVVFTTETVNINALADFYGSDPEQIRFYNQLGADDLVPSGRWLIIPLLAVTP